MLYFDNCDVRINGTGVLADSASINSRNSISPAYSLGFKYPLNQVSEGPIETNIGVSYFMIISGDPIFPIVNTLKNLDPSVPYSGISGVLIGGVTGFNCYLNSFSIRSNPNELTKVNASFITFNSLSGQFRNKTSPQIIFGDGSESSLGIGWTTLILSGNSYQTNPIYELNYNFNAIWHPVFLLGSQTPSQVILQGISERISFAREQYFHVNYSGEVPYGVETNKMINGFPDQSSITFSGYGTGSLVNNFPPLTINISGSRIQSSDVQARIDDFVRTTTTITNYF